MVPTATMVGPELHVRVDGAADRYWGGGLSCSDHKTHVAGEQGPSKSPLDKIKVHGKRGGIEHK
jgi:hypothetical protein